MADPEHGQQFVAFPALPFRAHFFGQPTPSPDATRVLVPLVRFGYSSDPNASFPPQTSTAVSLELLGPGSVVSIAVPSEPTVNSTRTTLAYEGRTAWDPRGTRTVFYAPMLDPQDGSWNSLKAQITVLSLNGINVSATTAPLEPRRWPISATWSDEGERITLIDGGVSEFSDPFIGDFTDCRIRRFHVTSSRTLVPIDSSVADDHVCSQITRYDNPLIDIPARAGDWCLTWSPCQNGDGGGGGVGGDGGSGGGGGVATHSVTTSPRKSLSLRGALCRNSPGIVRTPFCMPVSVTDRPRF